jgi:hypothetical protein
VVLPANAPSASSIADPQSKQIGLVVASALGVSPAFWAALSAVISACAPRSFAAISPGWRRASWMCWESKGSRQGALASRYEREAARGQLRPRAVGKVELKRAQQKARRGFPPGLRIRFLSTGFTGAGCIRRRRCEEAKPTKQRGKRHCERSEAIQGPHTRLWIASALRASQ